MDRDAASRTEAGVLGEALARWRERGRFGDALGTLLGEVIRRTGAERAMLVAVTSTGRHRVRWSRNLDGESVPDAEQWIALHAIRRTLESGVAQHFPDTRKDRRFRTEGERAHGGRTRSILVLPMQGQGSTSRAAGPPSREGTASARPAAGEPAGEGAHLLYVDSRFRELDGSADLLDSMRSYLDLIAIGLRGEGREQLLTRLERRVDRLERMAEEARARSPLQVREEPVERQVEFHGFFTRCPELIDACSELARLAPSALSILIEGESGTGKEVLVRAVHAASGRTGRFVTLHCGSIPDSLVEVELFGHARGAFTGADQARPGLVEHARGGTLFLDAIGEAPETLQNALLRLLESGRYRPLSDARERTADLRVIAARRVEPDGGRDIPSLREDLLYRLAGARFSIPPLRQRGEDIALLAEHFVDRYQGSPPASARPWFPDEVRAAMVAYHWPGNVRELENIIRRLASLGECQLDLARFERITGFRCHSAAHEGGETSRGVRAVVERAERDAIIRALEQNAGNKAQAARALGLSRKTLYRRMARHGIPL